jgi:aldose 1-epimerase
MKRLLFFLLSTFVFLLFTFCEKPMNKNYVDIKRENFQVERVGKQVDLFTLKNSNGMTVQLTNYGGKVVSILVPDKNGVLGDVCLGYESAQGYFNGSASLGATIGRYANRIAGGEFELDGKTYTLFKNNGPNTIHGGKGGFRFKVWDARVIDESSVELSYVSADGEEGFPGELTLKVVYSVTEENEFKLEYFAATTKPTVLNLTNHAFFNLKGEGAGDVLDHVLWVKAELFTPTDETAIPTGEIRAVKGTPFDFVVPKPLGQDIDTENDQLSYGKGFDHNYVLIKDKGALDLAAKISEPTTGRVMEVYTTEPGLQVYTANTLETVGKAGHVYGPRSSFCLETQHFPDSPHHAHFPSTVLRPGEEYNSTTIYKFLTE